MTEPPPVELRDRAYDHPDARALVDRVQREYTLLYGSGDQDHVATEQFAPPHGRFIVAYRGEVPIGMGGWRRRADGRAELKRIYVVDEERGRGLSKLVLAWLEDSAAAAGFTELVLETGSLQVPAVTLYRSVGYTDVEPFGHYAAEDGVVSLGLRLPRTAR